MDKENIITIALIVAGLVLLLVIFFTCKSPFQAHSTTMETSEAPKINKDSVVVVYADWCGHCKKFKPDMIKAAEKSDKVVLLNSDSKEGKAFMAENGVTGFPSIVKGGKTLNIPRTEDALIKATK